MVVRKINETELMEARNISALSFGWSHDTKGKTTEEYLKQIKENPPSKCDAYFLDTYAAFTGEGEMMSCLSLIPYEVNFDGSRLKMGGIGGVCTYPQHRRKGAVRELFRQALKDMYEQQVSFSYLYPFSEKFYGNFGYVPSSPSIRWNFSLKTIPDYSYDGTFHLYRGDGNYRDFETAYALFAEKYNMMVHRDSYDWDVLKSANPFKENRQAYLYKDRDGSPKGYFVFEKSNDQNRSILDCKEMIFDGFTSLKAIMSFARSFSSHYDTIQFDAPGCLSLDYFCEDYSQSASSRSIKQNGMVRVVNVKNVLEHALFQGTGELYIRIQDSFLECNNGTFHVKYKDGKASEVSSLDSLGAPDTGNAGQSRQASSEYRGNPDIEMTITRFSAVMAGNYDVADLDYLEGITLNCNKEKAGGLIFKKPCWIHNFF